MRDLVKVKTIYNHIVSDLKEFFKKAGYKKAVIGLSGGIDSALVAALTVDALRSENVQGISMPSRFTSQSSKDDARELSGNLLMPDLLEIPIKDVYSSMTSAMVDNIKGYSDLAIDQTEENIQARVRMMILHAYSNKYNTLVMNTCNLTEDLVGYATMYGDAAGAVSPLGNIGKMMVYSLAKYRNSRCKEGFKAIPASILTKSPTAELREGQTDEDSFGFSYENMDPLTRLLFHYQKTILIGLEHMRIPRALVFVEENSVDLMRKTFHPSMVSSVAQMMKSNAFKLKQAPPAIKIPDWMYGLED
jgi:NAD+ synthase (glutamine-hydrolysing)